MGERDAGIPVSVPKEMVNDDSYLVVALLVNPGDRVTEGRALAELETSKSAFTLSSPADGYFYPAFAAGEMVAVGADFGVVEPAPRGDAAAAGTAGSETAGESEPDGRFSKSAWEAFRESGLPLSAFSGMALVRRSDVETAIASGTGDARRVDGAGLPAGLAALSEPERGDLVVLLGGGGHARECIEIIECAAVLRIAGVLDTRARPGDLVAGYPVLGDNTALERLLKEGFANLVLAYGISGEHAARSGHFRALSERGFSFPAIIHPRAVVNRHARVGRGAQIMGGALIGSQAEIGDACIVNSNAVVSHDCVLDANVHIAPGAVLAGGVRVGRDTVIGMGATVYMRVRIGEGAVVYNGADVFADVPDRMAVRGEWRGER